MAALDLPGPAMLNRIVANAPFIADTALPCSVCPSPNHGDRRGRAIDSIILHYTGMPTASGALQRLCDPVAEVSSHYLIDEHGSLFQLVPEVRRAWHAGRSYWRGERDMNSASIGIEIANAGHDGGLPPFPDVQIATVIALCQDVIRRHAISADGILAHSDISPGRKIDPGERFPWKALCDAGVGIMPSESVATGSLILASGARGCRVAALQNALKKWGFEATGLGAESVYDDRTFAMIAAFQRHFRQESVHGFADPQTVAKLHGLLAMTAATA